MARLWNRELKQFTIRREMSSNNEALVTLTPSDAEGFNKAREQWTYNGRGLVSSHTEAPGTSIAATESFTYDLAGHQSTRTDYGGNAWTRIEDSCCEKQVASVDPLGHGTITNTDSNRRSVHTIQVSDVSTMTGSFANPTDAKTLARNDDQIRFSGQHHIRNDLAHCTRLGRSGQSTNCRSEWCLAVGWSDDSVSLRQQPDRWRWTG